MAYFTQWNISVKAHWPRHEVLPEECKITSFATGQCLCQNTKILLLKEHVSCTTLTCTYC